MDKSYKPSCFNVSSFCQQSWCYNYKAWYNIAQSIPKLRISCYLQTCWQNIEELTSFLPPIIESFVSFSMAGRLNLDSSVFKHDEQIRNNYVQACKKITNQMFLFSKCRFRKLKLKFRNLSISLFLFHYAPRPTPQTQLFPGPFHAHGFLHS